MWATVLRGLSRQSLSIQNSFKNSVVRTSKTQMSGLANLQISSVSVVSNYRLHNLNFLLEKISLLIAADENDMISQGHLLDIQNIKLCHNLQQVLLLLCDLLIAYILPTPCDCSSGSIQLLIKQHIIG